jgi:hypothetical protein
MQWKPAKPPPTTSTLGRPLGVVRAWVVMGR